MKTKLSLPPIALMLLTAFALSNGSAADSSPADLPLWILVTPPALRTSIEPLAAFRSKEGFQVVVLETGTSPKENPADKIDAPAIQRRIQDLCQGRKSGACVLLVGGMTASGGSSDNELPSLRGSHARMNGVPSDHGYGLPGDNGLETIAVGRFPARTAAEATQMVQKTIRFETNQPAASWRNRLVLLMGNPGGGPLPEMIVQQTLGPHLARLNPVWEVSAIFHADSSRYFAPTERLREISLRYLEAGELFSFYLGHSNARGLWSKSTNFLSRDDWAGLKIPDGNGVFFTCGCFACQPGGPGGPGYGLSAMRNPDGPVAVIGATAESYSAPGQLAVEGLIRQLQKEPFPTRLGDYWLAVQSGLAIGEMDQSIFSLYDHADGSGGKIPLVTQRLEHLEMWILLGDPAMKLPLPPMDISMQVEDIAPGRPFKVTGYFPKRLAGAKVHVTLERPLNSTPPGMEPLPANTSQNRPNFERVALLNLDRANTTILASSDVAATSNRFTCELAPPSSVPWTNLVVRASAVLNNDLALGVLSIPVSRLPQAQNRDATGK